MIRQLYDEYADLVILDFEVGLTGDERDRLDHVRMHLHRWQAIRERIGRMRCRKI